MRTGTNLFQVPLVLCTHKYVGLVPLQQNEGL